MTNWLKDRKKNAPPEESAKTAVSNIDQLLEVLRKVESIDQCLNVFHREGLMARTGLSTDHIGLLQKVCDRLREQGLGMEPNLIGQAMVRAIIDRHQAGALAIRLSSLDTDFRVLVSQADAARDAGHLELAQGRYWQALRLFPAHPGYRIQYAHCLKDQGLMPDAVLEYNDAFCFGAILKEIEPHALFAANAIGRQAGMEAILKRHTPHGDTLSWSLSSRDVITLHTLMLGYGPSRDEIVNYILQCNSRRSFLYTLLDKKDFVNTHRDMLRMINETGWSLQ